MMLARSAPAVGSRPAHLGARAPSSLLRAAPAARGRAAAPCRAALGDFLSNLMPKGAAGGRASPAAKAAVRALMEACEGTERGLATGDRREEIEAAVDVLAELGEGQVTTGDSLSATWKLLWTTEQETLWILKNAGLFGTQAGEVYQVIDVDGSTLQNVITFPPEGAFIVNSGIDPADDQRVNFKFSNAVLKLPSRSIKLPPVGKGWFESVYMDGNIRVARDIRGDTLVCVRDGPPRTFE